MASYKVGDRVRIVGVNAGSAYQHLLGSEAMVNEVPYFNGRGEQMVGVTVGSDPDFCFYPHQLEPLRPLPSIAEILAMTMLPEGPCREVVYVERAA